MLCAYTSCARRSTGPNDVVPSSEEEEALSFLPGVEPPPSLPPFPCQSARGRLLESAAKAGFDLNPIFVQEDALLARLA